MYAIGKVVVRSCRGSRLSPFAPNVIMSEFIHRSCVCESESVSGSQGGRKGGGRSIAETGALAFPDAAIQTRPDHPPFSISLRVVFQAVGFHRERPFFFLSFPPSQRRCLDHDLGGREIRMIVVVSLFVKRFVSLDVVVCWLVCFRKSMCPSSSCACRCRCCRC